MGRIVLTQTINGITRIVAERHVAEDLALPDTSYDVNGAPTGSSRSRGTPPGCLWMWSRSRTAGPEPQPTATRP
jgi:hypothetical protein